MIKRLYLTIILMVFAYIAIIPSVTATASAGALSSWQAKLESWDVEDVWPEVLKGLEQYPQEASLLETAAQIAYYRGAYEESLKLIKRSLEAGGKEEHRQAFALFVEETLQVLAPYKRYETPHFIITLDEKQDGILVDYLTDALEKTQQAMARLYGFTPREKVRVELFPNAKAFYRASTLSARDIEVTGAVGLTKFNKLQFLSPRALVHGYRWLDAVSHEYLHYLIVKSTSNKAPIWFHEGLAKYEETRWRQGPDYLSPLYRTLLAQALRDGKLIAFQNMEPSLLQLETPEEVQLAYAQAASAIEFIIRGSEGNLKRIMEGMVTSPTKGAGESIRKVLGLEFSEFEQRWKEFLAAKALKPQDGLARRRYKVKEGEGDEERLDLRDIKSQVARNRTHLGDKLKEQGRLRASVLEYQRALAEAGDSVPVMNRLSAALINLGRDKEALDAAKRALALDTDHPTPYTQLGQIYLQRKDFQQAKTAFEESLQINPFNPLVHAGLAEAWAALGDSTSSMREQDIVRALMRR